MFVEFSADWDGPALTLMSPDIVMHMFRGAVVRIGHTLALALPGRQVLRVTALFYLNEGWTSEHGGELRVYPYPSAPVKIAPLLGRVVLFHPRLAT